MHLDLIIKNAHIVTPTGIFDGDCGVANGRIEKIAPSVSAPAGISAREIDASGLFLMPGAIDMHVHFRTPGATEKEDFATGSAAAASGGVTTIFDMPNTNPPTISLEALEEKRRLAAASSIVNYGFYMGLTHDNLSAIRAARGIAGVKVYMAESTGGLFIVDHRVIEELFKIGRFVIVHAEDEHMIRERAKQYKDSHDPSVHSLIRNDEAAFSAVRKVLHLAKKHDAQVHVTHVSSDEELQELRKFHGPKVSADATPHHLFLTQAAYAERGNFVKVNPPLRSNEDRQALWKGLREGIIDAVATDHAPHTKAEKEKPYALAPSGVPGVETMTPLLLDAVNHGELSLRDVSRLTAEAPARILGISKKGRVEAGFDADLVLVDMEREAEVGRHGGPHNGYFTKCGWSPFSGRKLKGWPVLTMVGGNVVFENGRINTNVKGKEVTF